MDNSRETYLVNLLEACEEVIDNLRTILCVEENASITDKAQEIMKIYNEYKDTTEMFG